MTLDERAKIAQHLWVVDFRRDSGERDRYRMLVEGVTDYAIFLIGRYQEARSVHEDRESAYYTMFHGTAHVVFASGMTIAGATLCLHFTRLPYFQTLGIPMAVGMTVAVLAALTLAKKHASEK